MADLLITADGVDLRGLRVEEYEQLADLGAFEDERVELVGGAIVRVSPQDEPHSWAVMRLTAQLAGLMPRGYDVRVQMPLAVDAVSLPEPDLAVTQGQRSPTQRPVTALVVIEVAATSQRMDLVHKPPRYAAAGVPLYLVVDLPARSVIVHRDPAGSTYRDVATLSETDRLEVLGESLDIAELFGE